MFFLMHFTGEKCGLGEQRLSLYKKKCHLLNIKNPHINSEVTYKFSKIFRITSECFHT